MEKYLWSLLGAAMGFIFLAILFIALISPALCLAFSLPLWLMIVSIVLNLLAVFTLAYIFTAIK